MSYNVNWRVNTRPFIGNVENSTVADGRIIYHARDGLNDTVCKPVKEGNGVLYSVTPDVKSVTYSSDDKSLNMSIWLNGLARSWSSNGSLSQIKFGLEVSNSSYRSLSEYVNSTVTSIQDNPRFFIRNETGNIPISGKAAYGIVYTYEGKSDNCVFCKAMKILPTRGIPVNNKNMVPESMYSFTVRFNFMLLISFEIYLELCPFLVYPVAYVWAKRLELFY